MINTEQNIEQGVFRYPDGYLDLQRQADGTWRCQRYDNNYSCHWIDQISQPGYNITRAAAAIAFITGYAGPLERIDRNEFLQQRETHLQGRAKTVERPHHRIRR